MTLLADKRLVVVTGKGGVGKSTVSAALAVSFARAGQRTLVCEVNAPERISLFLGHRAVGAELSQLEENLWSVDVRPAEAMREYGLMILKFKTIYNAVFENRVVRYFLRFIPSLQELVVLGKILFHLEEKLPDGRWRFDRIVMDAPATGHALSFLAVPQVIIDTVPAGPLKRDAEKMRDLLVDPAVTAAVLVSLPEEMPVNETLELCTALRDRVGVHPVATILNGFVAERFSAADVEAVSRQSAALAEHARQHHDRSRMSQELERRLADGTRLPVTRIPRLYHARFGRESILEVAGHLTALVAGPA